MKTVKPLTGIEELRRAVRLFNACNETFNDSFTTEELILLARAHMKSEWDILPDTWEQVQIDQAIDYGYAPMWKEDQRGKIVSQYHVSMGDMVRVVADGSTGHHDLEVGTIGKVVFKNDKLSMLVIEIGDTCIATVPLVFVELVVGDDNG